MAYGQPLLRLDAAIVEVAARRILGVGLSARLPALHITAGIKFLRNLYLKRCAELLDSALRVAGSAIVSAVAHVLHSLSGPPSPPFGLGS